MTTTVQLRRKAVACRSCPARVAFAVTEKGARMPLDLEPDPAGNVAVYVDGSGTARARVVTAAEPLATYEQLHLPHFASCAAARPRTPAARPPAVAPHTVTLIDAGVAVYALCSCSWGSEPWQTRSAAQDEHARHVTSSS